MGIYNYTLMSTIVSGEFAKNLPDYQKIEILMFVMGKVTILEGRYKLFLIGSSLILHGFTENSNQKVIWILCDINNNFLYKIYLSVMYIYRYS